MKLKPPENIVRRYCHGAPELRRGLRVVASGSAGRVLAGPKMIPGRHFQSWLVERKSDRRRIWYSCVSISSAIAEPQGRLP